MPFHPEGAARSSNRFMPAEGGSTEAQYSPSSRSRAVGLARRWNAGGAFGLVRRGSR